MSVKSFNKTAEVAAGFLGGWGGDSPNDALWDLDAVHGDGFMQFVQTVHVLNLTAELGAVTCAHTHTNKTKGQRH